MSSASTREAFEAIVNQRLLVQRKEGEPPVELQLVGVRDLGAFASPRAFALDFRGPREPQLSQGTFSFAHAQLGTTAIFLVPVARDGEGTSYEAIFNLR